MIGGRRLETKIGPEERLDRPLLSLFWIVIESWVVIVASALTDPVKIANRNAKIDKLIRLVMYFTVTPINNSIILNHLKHFEIEDN